MYRDSSPMSNLNLLPPQPPSGIDPEVLSKINALFEKPEAIETPMPQRLPTETTKKLEAWWTNTEAPSADRKVVDGVECEGHHELQKELQDQEESKGENSDGNSAVDDEDGFEFDDEDFFTLASENDVNTNIESYDLDNLFRPESAPVCQPPPEPVDSRAPKIVARYFYPSERQPGPPLPLPRQPNGAWSTLPYIVAIAYRFIVELIKDVFCSSGPMIIEYSKHQIRQNANKVRVEAQAVEFEVPNPVNTVITAPDEVIGVVALLHVGHDDEREAIPIVARPKRVRQLLMEAGWDPLEDLYGKHIKVALKELSGMTGA